MKKLSIYVLFILFFFLIGCDNKSETNRKKSKIKLSCELKKVHVIKKYDGSDTDVWFDQEFIKKNLGELAKPITLEIYDKDSGAMWQDKQPVLLQYHDEKGLGYLNTSDAKKEGFTILHFLSINYENLKFTSEASMMIKDDDSKYNYNFNNKPEISSKGYGVCEKLKWDIK